MHPISIASISNDKSNMNDLHKAGDKYEVCCTITSCALNIVFDENISGVEGGIYRHFWFRSFALCVTHNSALSHLGLKMSRNGKRLRAGNIQFQKCIMFLCDD